MTYSNKAREAVEAGLAASAIAGHPIDDAEVIDLAHQVADGQLTGDDAVAQLLAKHGHDQEPPQ